MENPLQRKWKEARPPCNAKIRRQTIHKTLIVLFSN